MRLRVRYHRPVDLVREHDEQLVRGGLLVRVDPPAELSLYDAVELEIVAPTGAQVVLAGEVVQLLPGVGVAIGVATEARPALLPLVEAARAAVSAGEAAGAAPAPTHEIVAAVAPPAPVPSRDNPDDHLRYRNATLAQKIEMAVHGGRNVRSLVLRDLNRSLQQYVLKNPRLGLDEVLAMARLPNASIDVLQEIGERPEWAQRPEIALALVRNPRTPVPLAVRILGHVGEQELRRLGRDTGVRLPIRQAALRKLGGGRVT